MEFDLFARGVGAVHQCVLDPILGPAGRDLEVRILLHRHLGSPIRRPENQKKILVGLGLDKMHKIVERQDTPEVRGAIAKIPHLVTVVD